MPFPLQGVNACFEGFSTDGIRGFQDDPSVDRATRPRVRCAQSETRRMSKLNEANDRLDAAMASLEQAVELRRNNEVPSQTADGQANELQAELDKLRADFTTLRDTSGTVSSRLDDAIGRLRNMLDE
jgi:hypothetical protein